MTASAGDYATAMFRHDGWRVRNAMRRPGMPATLAKPGIEKCPVIELIRFFARQFPTKCAEEV